MASAEQSTLFRHEERGGAVGVRNVAKRVPTHRDSARVKLVQYTKESVRRRVERDELFRHLLGPVKPICVCAVAHAVARWWLYACALGALLGRHPATD
eukprot:5219105-Prymnesium_polylepis.1